MSIQTYACGICNIFLPFLTGIAGDTRSAIGTGEASWNAGGASARVIVVFVGAEAGSAIGVDL